MEIRHLRYFATVVEAGSLTAAAARLHMSQPPLSVAIQKLEAEVGVPLLERSARGVEPTSAGRFLLDRSSRVLGEVDDIAATLARYGDGAAGTLTVAAVPALLWRRIPAALRELAAQVPEVDVRLLDPPPWTAIDMVLERRADVAAILVADARAFAVRHRGELDISDWGEVPLVAALPPGEADAPDPLPLSALEGREVLVPRRTTAVPSLPEAVDDTLRRHRIGATLRTVETIQTSVPLIEAGLGCAVLPDADRDSLRRFALTVRALEPAPQPLRALVLTRAGETNPAVRRLVSILGG
ncbi:LysR family transcriptional regulator [uncultured Demequina sp.]|uniref:LysR family transcriptional regulator n=1 Tax=uncultured Demequina sp. TaxID=693499 RepID=UPI0025CDED54|nr:LysR family transcriptional regulator [uncultured Demequina sp.]